MSPQTVKRLTGQTLKQRLKPFFDRPEVRRLPGKGRPVDLAHRRKQVQVMAPDVAIDAAIGVIAQNLTYELAGHDDAVRNCGAGAALTKALSSGTYFIRVQGTNFTETRRLTVVR